MVCKKIGIDFHGVINTNPQFFKKLITVMLEQNIEVHIISGGPRDFLEQYLREKQIPYTTLWCIFDFYESKNKVTFNNDGTFYVDTNLWDTAKAEYCCKEGINMHIDDSVIYEKNFSTPYCRYDIEEQKCYVGKQGVSFRGNPHNVLVRLLKLCKLI